MSLVLTQIENRMGTVTFNNDRKLNSLSHQFAQELIDAFAEMEQADVLAVILRSKPGAKVWSAGHDINELPTGRRDPLGYDDFLERLLRCVQDFPSPVIALVEGTVWGGACDLCISCDIVICAEESTFAITPAKIGLPYNASGLVHFINVVGPHKAKEMFYTAQPVQAHDAWAMSLVNHVVKKSDLESVTYKIAESITHNAPLAVRALKKQFRLLLKGQLLSTERFENIQSIRRQVYDSEDYLEGINSFKEKRPPKFQGK